MNHNFIQKTISDDLEKNIVTRFAPEPNGFLHIGHVKSIWINFSLAQQFGGRCNLRFDNTNPMREEQTYINAILDDIRWLGFQFKCVRYASSYFEQLYAWAQHLVREGKAYVCDLSTEEISKYRGTLTKPGRNSPYRSRKTNVNLDLLERMRNGEFASGSKVLRAKIDMAAPNLNFRDPVLYRIVIVDVNAWKISPSYDFTHGQSDAIEGVTHSICTLEFEDHRPLYNWFIENLPVPYRPRQIEFSRMNLKYTITSKRKLKLLLSNCIVSGWEDPRMPTISGMRRRGYTPASLHQLCSMTGVTRANGLVDIKMLYHAIREDLEKTAIHAMCVLKPLKVVLTNIEEDHEETLKVPAHPHSMGVRYIPLNREIWIDADDFMLEPQRNFFRLAPEKEVILRNAYVIRCDNVITDKLCKPIELHCSVTHTHRKIKGVIHWVSARHGVSVEVRNYEKLFTVDSPNLNHPNPKSLTIGQAIGEPSLRDATPERRYQFERVGYFCADRSSEGALVFNRTVSLKDGWKREKGKVKREK